MDEAIAVSRHVHELRAGKRFINDAVFAHFPRHFAILRGLPSGYTRQDVRADMEYAFQSAMQMILGKLECCAVFVVEYIKRRRPQTHKRRAFFLNAVDALDNHVFFKSMRGHGMRAKMAS